MKSSAEAEDEEEEDDISESRFMIFETVLSRGMFLLDGERGGVSGGWLEVVANRGACSCFALVDWSAASSSSSSSSSSSYSSSSLASL